MHQSANRVAVYATMEGSDEGIRLQNTIHCMQEKHEYGWPRHLFQNFVKHPTAEEKDEIVLDRDRFETNQEARMASSQSQGISEAVAEKHCESLQEKLTQVHQQKLVAKRDEQRKFEELKHKAVEEALARKRQIDNDNTIRTHAPKKLKLQADVTLAIEKIADAQNQEEPQEVEYNKLTAERALMTPKSQKLRAMQGAKLFAMRDWHH